MSNNLPLPSDSSVLISIKSKLIKRLLQVLRVTQLALVLVAIITIFLGKLNYTIALLSTAVLLFTVNWAIYKKNTTLASTILLATLAIALSYFAWVGSGIRSTAMIGYCGVLILTAMLGSRRLLIGLMALMFSTCVLIIYSNISGLHVNTVEPMSIFTGMIVMIVLGIIGFNVWLMAYDYRSALDDLTHENSLVNDAKLKIEHMALHDQLTELPNRNMARQTFQEAFELAEERNQPLAVIFIDLDNLKPINDSLGHQAGDAILKEVSKRLKAIAKDQHIVCRYGGDEFIMILQNIHSAEDASAVAVIILNNISQTFAIKTIDINCTCSIGIAMAPRDGHDLDTLIKKADIAMYQSKDSGRNSFRFFDVANSQQMFEHLNLATSMRKALADNQFILYYQPKINLHDHSLVGFEALIRWQHPQYGFISPETFISLAESSGVIIQLGEWVLNEACLQGKRWIDKGFKDFSIAVNVSSIQFKRGTIDSVVLNALEKTKFPPTMLELELTESLLIDDTDRLAATLSNLRAMGLTFSIDDFGTGYSNLGYLKKFEVSYLKIDQSFVRRMEQNPEDALIVKAIIQLSSSLGLETIAEGVETESAANILRGLGCKMAQGYLWSRPLPAREIERFWCDWCLLEQLD
ncbi:MAG: EAL domain-containing protein [Gammaproteobacteria bacterium]|nr:MAG: EAL domain-containing protein [Gammaproteobacteria bacterium]